MPCCGCMLVVPCHYPSIDPSIHPANQPATVLFCLSLDFNFLSFLSGCSLCLLCFAFPRLPSLAILWPSFCFYTLQSSSVHSYYLVGDKHRSATPRLLSAIRRSPPHPSIRRNCKRLSGFHRPPQTAGRIISAHSLTLVSYLPSQPRTPIQNWRMHILVV